MWRCAQLVLPQIAIAIAVARTQHKLAIELLSFSVSGRLAVATAWLCVLIACCGFCFCSHVFVLVFGFCLPDVCVQVTLPVSVFVN
jgi:hypothetical protein